MQLNCTISYALMHSLTNKLRHIALMRSEWRRWRQLKTNQTVFRISCEREVWCNVICNKLSIY